MKQRLAAWAAPAGAALVAAWMHAASLRAPFFADDWLFLDATRHRSWLAALAAPDPLGNFARPLGRQAWFWLLDRLGGGAPFAFHAANLALFVGAVLLLAALVHRLAGARAAAIAAALFALTQAADVPVRWASGSQDLLAVTLALGALWVLASSAAGLVPGLAAAVLFAAALLAKETVLLLPCVALVLVARERAWRAALARTAPLFAVAALWCATLGARGLAFALSGAGAEPAGGHEPLASRAAAAVVAFARTFAGAEFARGTPAPILPGVLLAIALAAALVPLATVLHPVRGDAAAGAPQPRFAAAWVGLAWVIAGIAPVVPVAHLWSAYYFLFALCGAALGVGALLGRAPSWAGALVVAALGWGAAHSRALETFARAPGAWAWCSHVNRRYLVEGSGRTQALLAELQRLHPTLAPGTTLFWSGLPAWMAFQAGDGPLVRIAYADTSLRSYYLADLTTARARRGPFRVISGRPDTGQLEDRSGDRAFLVNVAMTMLVRGAGEAVDGALELARTRGPLPPEAAYVAAFRSWERGEHEGAAQALAALGFAAEGGAEEQFREAAEAITRGDTATAAALARQARQRHVLDPAVQGLLADLWLPAEGARAEGVLAAYASRELAPDFPYRWRRWASVQLLFGHYALARESLERYFQLAPEARAADAEALRWLDRLVKLPPAAGGDEAAVRPGS
ncbi:MAG: hypothetical protein U0704_04490 [Candidatus Eisenbacteria bacterium]